MPLYEYEDIKTGQRCELSRPVRLRDHCPPNLRRVVSRTGRPRIGRGGLPDPAHANHAVPRALQQLEDTMPAAQIERETGFSAKQLKRIWGF